MQSTGTIRANIAGHGQFTIRATDLDAIVEEHWNDSRDSLVKTVKEHMGDPGYDTTGMTKLELIMVIAELSGFGL